MLAENPHSHPIIILPTEIRMWELQAMIEFMYKGEVNVSKAGLADLLRCAGTLQISGLCGAHAQNHLNQLVIGGGGGGAAAQIGKKELSASVISVDGASGGDEQDNSNGGEEEMAMTRSEERSGKLQNAEHAEIEEVRPQLRTYRNNMLRLRNSASSEFLYICQLALKTRFKFFYENYSS